MISVYYSEKSEYGKIGLEHFIRTYGIILSEKSPFVNISYGCSIAKNKNYRFEIIVKYSKINDFEYLIYYGPKILSSFLNSKDRLQFIKSIPFVLLNSNSIDINLDIFSFIGRCLTGDLESFWKSASKPEREELGKIPFIDVYEKMLFLVLLHVFEEMRLPFVSKPFWPGKKFAVCLTHDVDEVKKTYQWVTRPLIYLKNMQMHLLKGQLYSLWYKLHGKEPFWTFDEIMKIESELNVKSSFYFLKEKSKAKVFAPNTWKLLGRRYDFNDMKVRPVMKQLYAGGWDIGLHGSYNSYYNLEILEKEKNELQMSLGNGIIGIRHHHLNLEIPKTWEYHEKIGLEYDTTLGFKDQMGFRGGTCLPFHPYSKQKKMNLLEIPLVIMDTPLFKYNKEDLSEEFETLINKTSELNGVLTLLWHHSVFNEHEFPGWIDAYKKIIKLCREKNAWITSAKEISDWWKWREKTSFEWDYEGTMLRITPYPKESSHFPNIYLPKNMITKKISNAKVIESDEKLFTIQTNNLKNNEYVEIEFSEQDHGN